MWITKPAIQVHYKEKSNIKTDRNGKIEKYWDSWISYFLTCSMFYCSRIPLDIHKLPKPTQIVIICLKNSLWLDCQTHIKGNMKKRIQNEGFYRTEKEKLWSLLAQHVSRKLYVQIVFLICVSKTLGSLLIFKKRKFL